MRSGLSLKLEPLALARDIPQEKVRQYNLMVINTEII